MVLMKYFLYCFPVRLGALITTSLVIVENLAILAVLLLYSESDIKEKAEKLKETVKELSSFDYFDQFLDFVTTDPSTIRWISIGVCSACLLSCLLNLISALLQLRWLSVPYIFIRFFEILIILAIHVVCMMLMKKDWNLGILILACCIGGFGILFLFYLWAVTFAMFQMIGRVKSKEYQERLLQESSSSTPKSNASTSKLPSVATVGQTSFSYQNPSQIFASDFSEVYRKNYRRI